MNPRSVTLQLNSLDESMRRMEPYEVSRGAAPPDAIPNYKPDIFAYKGTVQAPWKSEQTHSYSHPKVRVDLGTPTPPTPPSPAYHHARNETPELTRAHPHAPKQQATCTAASSNTSHALPAATKTHDLPYRQARVLLWCWHPCAHRLSPPAHRAHTLTVLRCCRTLPTQEYTGRILSGSLVHTGGNTEMAHTTHHTVERPQFPPGTIRAATFTVTQYVPNADPALYVSGPTRPTARVCRTCRPEPDLENVTDLPQRQLLVTITVLRASVHFCLHILQGILLCIPSSGTPTHPYRASPPAYPSLPACRSSTRWPTPLRPSCLRCWTPAAPTTCTRPTAGSPPPAS